MLPLQTRPDAALSRLEDEALVLLVQQHGPRHPATQVLLGRHLAWVCRRAAWLARRRRLHHNDVLDAQQEAVLAAVDAIHAYAPTRQQDGTCCTFRSFLCRVVGARIGNFLRTLQRAAARQHCQQHVEQRRRCVAVKAALLLPRPAKAADPPSALVLAAQPALMSSPGQRDQGHEGKQEQQRHSSPSGRCNPDPPRAHAGADG
ncbi:MAG TPA: hypothetical protein VEL76_05020 [Gemmataceae bacterium]|nr:hypothetical protein [Gemmataceae bacterium]